MKVRIKRAIEERLMDDPKKYGRPLRKSLKVYWKLRVGDYRIIVNILHNENMIFVRAMGHRKNIYKNLWNLMWIHNLY